MKPGTLVRIFAPGEGLNEFGVALFLRRLIPSRDLSADHDFWRNRDNVKPDVIADSWHNEVLYRSGIHIIAEKQFVLVPLDVCK